jgi:hypothetical protein
VALFDVRDAEVAYGEEEVCLVAEARDGETLEGCDAIQTLPAWLRSGGTTSRFPPDSRPGLQTPSPHDAYAPAVRPDT